MKFESKVLLFLIALIAAPTISVLACTNIIVTRGASVDGSNLISYAADSHALYGELYFSPAATHSEGAMREIHEWDTGKFLGKIPQPKQTYQRVGNINEHQVIITETTFGGRSELQDPEGVMDYGSLIYVALERAKTAREAIAIIDELMQAYGYYSSGESFSIADKNECWFMEIIGKGAAEKGAVWVAVKIPDGYISAHANQARITTFPLNDSENCLYSKDVISFARKSGYYDGSDAEFSFSDTYCPLDFGGMRFCEARVWSVFNMAGCDVSEYLDYAMGYDSSKRMPLYMKAANKLTVKDVAEYMRDHYDGTPMDKHADIGSGGEGSPFRMTPLTYSYNDKTYINERAIATQQTGWWMIGQARNFLPNEVGGVLWFGVDDASTSALTPIYASTRTIPESLREGNGHMTQYSPTAAFWITNRVSQFAYFRFNSVYPDLKNAIDNHENGALDKQNEIDRKAVELLESSKDSAVDYLTYYSVQTAQELFKTWQELDQYLIVKFIDGNVKQEDENGFIDNGNGRNIPAKPLTPGYSDTWKKAVTESCGDRLISR